MFLFKLWRSGEVECLRYWFCWIWCKRLCVLLILGVSGRQVLYHNAADPAGMRRADGGGSADWPHRQVRPRHGDLPAARPEQTVHQRLRLGLVQQPHQLEEHARVQHPAGLQRQRPHPPVRQEEIRGRHGGRGEWRQVDAFLDVVSTHIHSSLHTNTCKHAAFLRLFLTTITFFS